MASVIARNLSKAYGKHLAVDKISFEIHAGEVFGFLGPNGAGKSTTISMITGISKPTAGKLQVLGDKMPKDRKEIQRKIGYVPQELVFYNHLTVKENLVLFARSYKLKDINKTVSNAIHAMKMEEFRNQRASTLSGGQKRRLNVAIGLLNNPELLVLDEPSAGMDPQSRNVLWECIRELAKEDLTIILTTHLMETADLLSNRICIIDHGEIKAIDTPENLKKTIGTGDVIDISFSSEIPNQTFESFKNIIKSYDQQATLHLTESNSVSITVIDGITALTQIVAPIKGAIEGNNSIENINLRDNTLEDVFIELTGRKLRE